MKTVIPFLLILLLLSCKKNEEADKPVIILNSPSNGTSYHKNDTVFIRGQVNHSIGLQEVSVMLDKMGNNVVPAYHAHYETDSIAFILNTYYVVKDTSKTTYNLLIEASDPAGNISTKQINFVVLK